MQWLCLLFRAQIIRKITSARLRFLRIRNFTTYFCVNWLFIHSLDFFETLLKTKRPFSSHSFFFFFFFFRPLFQLECEVNLWRQFNLLPSGTLPFTNFSPTIKIFIVVTSHCIPLLLFNSIQFSFYLLFFFLQILGFCLPKECSLLKVGEEIIKVWSKQGQQGQGKQFYYYNIWKIKRRMKCLYQLGAHTLQGHLLNNSHSNQ